jgi:hypothetical protein
MACIFVSFLLLTIIFFTKTFPGDKPFQYGTAEAVCVTLDRCSILMLLVARGCFIAFSDRKSFKSYKIIL